MLDFHQQLLLPPPSSLTKIATSQWENPVPTFCCCKKVQLDALDVTELTTKANLPRLVKKNLTHMSYMNLTLSDTLSEDETTASS